MWQKFGDMSKIGKLPIKLPEGVGVEVVGDVVKVSGPKGNLSLRISNLIKLEEKEGILTLSLKKNNPKYFPIYGTMRSLLSNMVEGVFRGWTKEMELVGAGYKAELSGETLVLNVGYSHPVKIEAPEGINFKVEKTFITVEGIDKELVGQIAAEIRAVRKPEPYKGKGIRYIDEIVRRKAGKAAKTVGVA